jgi:hypothetical protein
MVKLTADDVAGPFGLSIPQEAGSAGQAQRHVHYRNMLEKLAERYHTTPATVVALNGPDKLIGEGQTQRLPNVLPGNRDYGGALDKQGAAAGGVQHRRQSAQGRLHRCRQERRHDESLPVGWQQQGRQGVSFRSGTLVAQFPVTTGSGHDPLPLGSWKVRPIRSCRRSTTSRTCSGTSQTTRPSNAFAGTERPGWSRLARPHQGPLRHPR